MPTYEYVCTDCGEPVEVVQSIHDPALTECPSCHGRLRKVFGNVGVVFKGSGFYRTDSRDKKSSTAPAKKAAAPAAASSDAATPASTSTPAGGGGSPATPAPSSASSAGTGA